MELNFKEFGQGEPVVILHGLFGMLDNWQSIAKKLAEHFTVYILDLRNHGKSPHSEEFNYDVLAADVQHFMESHWMYDGAHLIGHSMGGKTAMHFALRNPDLATTLTVVDIAPRAYNGGHEAYFEAMLALNLESTKNRKEAEAFLAERIHNKAELQFILKNLSRDDETEEFFEWKLNLRSLHRNYPLIMGGVGAAGETFDKRTLFIRGGNSKYLQDDDMDLIKIKFPRAEFFTVPDAGHWVHAEAPALFTKTVLDFLLK